MGSADVRVRGGSLRSAIGQTPRPQPFSLARLPAVRDELPPPAAQASSPLLPRPEAGASVEGLPAETLQAAWTQALVVDEQLMAGAARVESAAYALDAASAQRLPLLGVSADYVVRDNEPAFRIESPVLPFSFTTPYLPRDNCAFEGRVDVPIYTGGRVTSEIDAAQCNVRAMERRLDRDRLDLKLRVAEDYVAVLRASKKWRWATVMNGAWPPTRTISSYCMNSNACRAAICCPLRSRWPTRSTR